MSRCFGFAVRLAGAVALIVQAPMVVAQQASARGLPEPIAVDGGKITGTPTIQWTTGVRLFRGIPFAAPPVGDRRWRAPQPVVPWEGVKRAEDFSPACMQAPTVTEGNAWREGHTPVSEDCLYLNVWTPARSATDRLPVMVWIHGGGNSRGAASENQYDGAYLAKRGVVFVSLNYRMNVFGFMAHPELTRESEHGSSGNYALLDQIAALRWVQRNIANFGGDPNRVMVFGHSAGGANVVSLVASPLGSGLFHRAMVLSGSGLATNRTLQSAEGDGVAFAQGVGATSIAALRRMPAEAILNAQRPQMGPIVDGWVLPEPTYSIYASGRQNRVPLIVGTVADDVQGYNPPAVTVAEARAAARDTYGSLADDYLSLFPASTDAEATQSALAYRRINGITNARLLARLHSSTAKVPTYWYYFNHLAPVPENIEWGGRPARTWGVSHGSELMFVFNAFPFQDWEWRPVDHDLSKVITSMMVNFAGTGSPNGGGLPEWPEFDPARDVFMNFGGTAKAETAPFSRHVRFLDDWQVRQRNRD